MSQGQPARSATTASKAAHMSEDAAQYRERAEEARQLAEKFINPSIRKYGFVLLANGSSLRRGPKSKRKSKAAN
jgi:hypothetical protein